VSESDSKSESTDPSPEELLKQELETSKKEYLYLRADFENYKKSAIKERSELIKFGAERTAIELLNLVDSFEKAMALEVTADNVDQFRQGLAMLKNEFSQVLNRLGVQRVDSQGKPFDPHHHEAISTEPTDQIPSGHVLRVFKEAYRLHDKIIRPAQVVVSKEVPPADTP
jgi:molecular chaperone GrpE